MFSTVKKRMNCVLVILTLLVSVNPNRTECKRNAVVTFGMSCHETDTLRVVNILNVVNPVHK